MKAENERLRGATGRKRPSHRRRTGRDKGPPWGREAGGQASAREAPWGTPVRTGLPRRN